jgi:hypothetical protein
MKSNKLDIRFAILALIVLVAAMSRLLPHPPNMTALSAMALFGGAYFSKKWQTILLPLTAFWLSDLVLNNVIYKEYYPSFTWFSSSFYFAAASLVLMTVVSGILLKVVNVRNVIASSLVASVIFFLVSNFGVWIGGGMYPMNSIGLATCYTAGLPFFSNTLIGDLLWSAILFGGFAYAQSRFPVLAAA